ncbi:MAG TPA: creatininase family protein [bacterium]|nr:creatininase family protein [bacterium]HOL67894.1 creatininase family protein [bacterium]
MKYELMFPDQLRKAIDENWPVVLPVGVLEYHAEHCVVGVDALLVIRAVEILEKEMSLVMLPPFVYGAASYAVEPPERNGTVNVNPAAIHSLAREIFTGFLRVGFRNIHVFIHHQSENFVAGMPTDLAMKLAAREAIFQLIEKDLGEGWWGEERMANYYQQHQAGSNPFNWIQFHPFMDEETQRLFPIDHAGRQETSLMMAFCPEGVDLKRLVKRKWYCREAEQASLSYGQAAREKILKRMRDLLRGS